MDPYAPIHPSDPQHTPEAGRLTDLILEVFRLYGLFEEHGSRLTRPHQQSTARWRVLGAAARQQGTVSQIARRIGLTRQGVQRTANALARDGLIEFATNPAHRRSPFVTLTAAGERVLRDLAAAQIEWSNRVAHCLRLGDLETAVALLRELATRLECWDGTGELPSLDA